MAMWSSHCQVHYLALHEGVLPAWTCECILGATQQETQSQPQLTSTTTLGRNSTFVFQARNLKVEILTNWSQQGFSSSTSRLCRDKCSTNWLSKNSHCHQGGNGGCSAPPGGAQHPPRAAPKQLPWQHERDEIFRSITCVRNGEMGNIF